MRYVSLNEDGTIDVSYNDDTIEDLPKGCVELSEEEWDNRLLYKRVNGEWVEIPKPQEQEEELE